MATATEGTSLLPTADLALSAAKEWLDAEEEYAKTFDNLAAGNSPEAERLLSGVLSNEYRTLWALLAQHLTCATGPLEDCDDEVLTILHALNAKAEIPAEWIAALKEQRLG